MADNPSSVAAGFDIERSVVAPFTGVAQNLGSPLTQNPVILIFDNQSTVAVAVSFNNDPTWKTFSAGEALILDLRANHGSSYNFTVSLGTQIKATGTAGTGAFRVSIVYPR